MHYVIIGNGVAGVTAALEIRYREADAEITLISSETDFHYSRTALMWGYTGQLTPRDMEPYERGFWKEMKIALVRDYVERLEENANCLRLRRGGMLKYDKLLLAVGAKANLFGWPGQDLDGVSTFTTMQDLQGMLAMKDRIQRAVVVGGGLIGIELVEIMLHHHVETTYLLREPWYWNRVLDRREADRVQRLIREHGGRVILEDEIGEIQGDQGRVKSVLTRKGEELPCDFVGVAVGVHPNLDLCKDTGIDAGRGIRVTPSLQTSIPNIWSAGDCAEIHYPGQEQPVIEQLWYTGIHQGRAAGRAMVGDPVNYQRGIWYNAAQFLAADYCNVGQLKQFQPEADEILHRGTYNGDQEWIVRIASVKDAVIGFSLLGPRWDSAVLRRWIEERRTPDYCLAHLADAEFSEEFTRFNAVAAGKEVTRV